MTTHYSLEAQTLLAPPKLIAQLKQTLGRRGTGFDEGSFVQQLHYWLSNPKCHGQMIDGSKWIYNSLHDWLEQFPWMSEYALRKAIANLKRLGLIETAQHWLDRCQRIMFYRIDYERLESFCEAMCGHGTPRCETDALQDVRSVHDSKPETLGIEFSPSTTPVVVPAEASVQSVPTSDAPPPEPCPVAANVLSPDLTDRTPISTTPESEALLRELQQGTARVPRAVEKEIRSHSPEKLQSVLSEFRRQKPQIKNAIGWIRQALRNPSFSVPQPKTRSLTHTQFDSLKAQGLLQATMLQAGDLWVLLPDDRWMLWEEFAQCPEVATVLRSSTT